MTKQGEDDDASVRSDVSLFNSVVAGFNRIFKYEDGLEPIREEEEIDGEEEPDPNDKRFLQVVNQTISTIDDFRSEHYPVEKEALERRLEDQKANLKSSMDKYTNTRRDRRSKETELESIKLMEELEVKQVNKNINAVEEISQELSDLNYKYKAAEYLRSEQQPSPKLYAIKGHGFARTHSKLDTQEDWDKLKGLSVEALQLLHGYRCTHLQLPADANDPNSRIFTYSQMKVKRKDGSNIIDKETPEQYIERLQKAMGWNSDQEDGELKRLRLIAEHERQLEELKAEQTEHVRKKRKTGDHQGGD